MILVQRELSARLNHALKTDRAIAIMGPRQAGKTTLVRRQLHPQRPTHYYNLKDPDIRASLKKHARQELNHYRDHVIILDEVQLLPELMERVQLAIDAQPGVAGQFVLLGSNHLLLNRQIKESLAGRVGLFNLPTLSLREMSGEGGPFLFDSLIGSQTIDEAQAHLQGWYVPTARHLALTAHLSTLVLYGGFPEFLTRHRAEDRQRWLRDYRRTYLEADLRELVELRNLDTFTRFETVFAPRIGSPINLSDLARDAGISPDTARRFLHYHEQLFIAWPCRPYFTNLIKRVVKAPKWYMNDTGIMRSITRDFDPGSGAAFENAVLSELRKRLYLTTLREELYYLRTSTGVEADAVLSSNNGSFTLYCEVKSSASPHNKDIRHLRRLITGDHSAVGLLVHQGDGIKRMEERIWAVPAAWLLA